MSGNYSPEQELTPPYRIIGTFHTFLNGNNHRFEQKVTEITVLTSPNPR